MIAAVVVLFHPEVDRLRNLYDALQAQVGVIFFIDNTPGCTGERYALQSEQGVWNVVYSALGNNLGIAQAQNVGIHQAFARNCEHVLLVDQDSVLPDGTVATLLRGEQNLLRLGRRVAAVGPVFVDVKTALPGKTHFHTWLGLRKSFVDLQATEPLETDWLIASGSLIRRSVLEQVGCMRAELFIDAVDMEWGLRARSQGLCSFIVPTAQIVHSVGDSFVRFFGASVILHSEIRNYYIARNWLYLLRIPTMGARWRSGALPHISKFFMLHLFLATDRIGLFKVLVRALLDAVQGRMGRYEIRPKSNLRHGSDLPTPVARKIAEN
jgi:rhamnosyltransferase